MLPWWTEILQEVLKKYPVRDFPVPEGIVFLKVDSQTGKLALPTCPKTHLETYIRGTEPAEFCAVDHSAPTELAPTTSLFPMASVFPPTTGQILTRTAPNKSAASVAPPPASFVPDRRSRTSHPLPCQRATDRLPCPGNGGTRSRNSRAAAARRDRRSRSARRRAYGKRTTLDQPPRVLRR